MSKSESKRIKGKQIRRALEMSVKQDVIGDRVTGRFLSRIGYGSGLSRPNNPNSSKKKKKTTERSLRDREEGRKKKGRYPSWYPRWIDPLPRDKVEEGKKFLEKHPKKLTRR
jgi:hypothetical protein